MSHTPKTCTSGLLVFAALNMMCGGRNRQLFGLNCTCCWRGRVSEAAECCCSHNQTGKWTTEQQRNVLLESRSRVRHSRSVPHFDNRTKPAGELRGKTEEVEEEEDRNIDKEFMAESTEALVCRSVCVRFDMSASQLWRKNSPRFQNSAPKKTHWFATGRVLARGDTQGPIQEFYHDRDAKWHDCYYIHTPSQRLSIASTITNFSRLHGPPGM